MSERATQRKEISLAFVTSGRKRAGPEAVNRFQGRLLCELWLAWVGGEKRVAQRREPSLFSGGNVVGAPSLGHDHHRAPGRPAGGLPEEPQHHVHHHGPQNHELRR